MRDHDKEFPVLAPDLQIAFSRRLEEMRGLYLHEALSGTVAATELRRLDEELASLVPPAALTRVAAVGLRGEVVFAVPCLLEANPHLLGYYRLLFGFSQKEFYSKSAFGPFVRCESQGQIPARARPFIPALCRSLISTGVLLVEQLDVLSLQHIHELQLLTLGTLLRGSELNRIGQRATAEVFALMEEVVRPYVQHTTRTTLSICNESGRDVTIVFAGDPDIRAVEQLPSGPRPLLSVEIKGGADASNVYNRIGEAEKSHLKQYEAGCREFWTIVRAPFRASRAAQDSPTTTRFFHFEGLQDPQSPEYAQFRDNLCSILGIRSRAGAANKRRSGSRRGQT